MFTQRQVEPCAAHQHRRGVSKLAEAPLTVVGTHAGVTRPIEGHALHHQMNTHLIDAAASIAGSSSRGVPSVDYV